MSVISGKCDLTVNETGTVLFGCSVIVFLVIVLCLLYFGRGFNEVVINKQVGEH